MPAIALVVDTAIELFRVLPTGLARNASPLSLRPRALSKLSCPSYLVTVLGMCARCAAQGGRFAEARSCLHEATMSVPSDPSCMASRRPMLNGGPSKRLTFSMADGGDPHGPLSNGGAPFDVGAAPSNPWPSKGTPGAIGPHASRAAASPCGGVCPDVRPVRQSSMGVRAPARLQQSLARPHTAAAILVGQQTQPEPPNPMVSCRRSRSRARVMTSGALPIVTKGNECEALPTTVATNATTRLKRAAHVLSRRSSSAGTAFFLSGTSSSGALSHSDGMPSDTRTAAAYEDIQALQRKA